MLAAPLGLSSSALKAIALITMTIDHIGYYLEIGGWFGTLLRIIGRIAAPLFFFLSCVSLDHTRNKPRYLLRMYIVNLIMQILTAIINALTRSSSSEPIESSILSTLLYSALFILCIKKVRYSSGFLKKLLYIMLIAAFLVVPIALLFLTENILIQAGVTPNNFTYVALYVTFYGVLPSPLLTEGSIVLVLLGVGLYFLKSKPLALSIFYIVFSLISQYFIVGPQVYMLLALPLILIYNGEKGKPLPRQFFYIYYPAHIYALYFINLLLRQ